MARNREQEILRITDELDDVFIDACIECGLGKKRLFEVAIVHLAEALERKDPRALATLEMWKKARTFVEVTEDALEVAKLRAQ